MLCHQNIVEKLSKVRKVLRNIVLDKCGWGKDWGEPIAGEEDVQLFMKLVKTIVESKDM